MRMNYQTVRSFIRALGYGSKYTYQTLPRILTIWLDMADDRERCTSQYGDSFQMISKEIAAAVSTVPVYKVSSPIPRE